MTALLLRDLKLSIRAGGGALIGVLFFLTIVAVIPFGVGPDLALLSRIGPAIVWIGALLAALLGLDRLFQAERDDGSLDLMLMQETPLVLTVLVGSPAITFIGAVGAAVAVALPRGGLLVSILVLPLTIPVLIFGVSATYAAVEGPSPFLPPFLILMALTLFFAVIGPVAAALALRHTSD
jgi:heme exporter protein B